MPVTIAEYFRPENLREALEILQSPGPPAMVLAGGVSFTLSGSPRPVRAVDLQNANLGMIRSSAQGLEIGAMTTLADLIESPEAAGILGGLIPQACRLAASTPLRNLITAGGNIAQCYYWSTLPPLLLAAGAEICLQSAGGKKSLSAEEYFSSHPQKHMAAGEIIVKIKVPAWPTAPGASRTRKDAAGAPLSWGAAYLKFATTTQEYAMMHAMAILGVEDRVVRVARVAVGALDTLPARCREAEDMVLGRPIEDGRSREAAHASAARLTIRKHLRASEAYRRRLAGVYIQSALLAAWQRAVPPRPGLHF